MKNKLDIKTAVADYAIMLAGAAVYATSVVVLRLLTILHRADLLVWLQCLIICSVCL